MPRPSRTSRCCRSRRSSFSPAGRWRAILPDTDGTDAIMSAVGTFLPLEIAPSLQSLGTTVHRGSARRGRRSGLAVGGELRVLVVGGRGQRRVRNHPAAPLLALAPQGVRRAIGWRAPPGGTVVVGHVASWLERYYLRTGAPAALSPRAHVASAIALLAVTFVVFTLFYKWLPRGKVAWSAAGRAAAVAVVLVGFRPPLLRRPAGELARVRVVLGRPGGNRRHHGVGLRARWP